MIAALLLLGRAPHKCEVRAVGLSVCRSVCRSVRTFMTRKYTRVILIYGIPSVVDCSIDYRGARGTPLYNL